MMDVTVNKTRYATYQKFLKTNFNSIQRHSSCNPSQGHACHIVYLDGPPSYKATGPVYDAVWLGPFNQSRPIQQTSALDLLLAGSERNVICVGKACSYDPINPPPRPLTCHDNPCPLSQQCCEYESQYTCCAEGQTCNHGFCE